MDKQQVIDILLEAKEAYYAGNPVMTDAEFDELENDLRKFDPNNDYFNIVGIPEQGEKIKHKIPMLSAGKAKSVDEVIEWLNKILDKRVELIIEPKVDSFSTTIVYDNGKLQYIATRGDGIEGRIITHIKDYINIPKIISYTTRIEVRGETYLNQNTKFPNPDNKPLRNLAVGLINRKDSGLEDLKYLNFVAYQLFFESDDGVELGQLLNENSKIDHLEKMGFPVVPYKLIMTMKELREYFEEYKNSLREKWDYQTDGLMIIVNDNLLYNEINSKYVVEHHNHYNIALKPPSESRWSVVTGLDKQVSKSGAVIPVVTFNPILIGGSTIERATANNFKNVKNLKLNIGDKIHISKANDVIPFIIETVPKKEESELIPKICPSCSTILEWETREEKDKIVEGVHLICKNPDCSEKNIQLITSWIEGCEMDDVAEATIRLLYEKKFIKDIIDLYNLKDHKESLKDLEGMGEKKVENLLYQIEKSKDMTIVQFLARLSIPLVGEKAVKKLGINTVLDFWYFDNPTYKIGKNIIAYKNENMEMLYELLKLLNIIDIQNVQIKGTVCLTGNGHKDRKLLIEDLESMGYEFTDNVTKTTTILVCDDVNGNSGKLQKAKKYGIAITSYEQFFV